MYTEPITLDHERELALSFMIIRKSDQRLAKDYGMSFFQMIQALGEGNLNFDYITIVYFYMLQHNDPKLTEQQVETLLDTAITDGRYDVTDLIERISTLAAESGVLSKQTESEGIENPLASASG